MTPAEKIEKYLLDMNLSFNEMDNSTWIIEGDDNKAGNIVIKYEDPVVLFRVKVMNTPSNNREDFYKKILELNATDMIYGAYGLEGDSVVIINTLAAENLDFNEFQSTIESISLALIQHYGVLQKYLSKEGVL